MLLVKFAALLLPWLLSPGSLRTEYLGYEAERIPGPSLAV
jgi:hypothetical protein